MLQLRVYGAAPMIARVAERVDAVPGSRHVLVMRNGGAGAAVVTADVSGDAADAAIAVVRELGVPAEDVELLRLDSIGPATASRPLGGVVWADLLTQAGANARPLARYVVFMAAAGVIAAFGVIYDNQILIVGAMAVSPTRSRSRRPARRWCWAAGDWQDERSRRSPSVSSSPASSPAG